MRNWKIGSMKRWTIERSFFIALDPFLKISRDCIERCSMIEKLTGGESGSRARIKKAVYFSREWNERATWPRYGDPIGEARSASPITESRAGVNPETRRVTEYYYSTPVDRLYRCRWKPSSILDICHEKIVGCTTPERKTDRWLLRAHPIPLITCMEFNRLVRPP